MFSTLVVCYLFLGGAGAGACLVLAVLGLLSPRDQVAVMTSSRSKRRRAMMRVPNAYRLLFVPGLIAALGTLIVGMIFLAVDLGRADRIVLLFIAPSASYITAGAWSLMLCAALSLLLLMVWMGLGRWRDAVVRVMEVLVIVASIVVMVYTGLLLQSMPSVPLWNTPWLPVLFVLSSASCGIALVLGISVFSGAGQAFHGVLKRLVVVDAVLVAAEGVVLALFLAMLAGTLPAESSLIDGTQMAASTSLQELIAGDYAYLFWSGFVLVGLLIPLVLDIVLARRARFLPGTILAVAACVLVGGFILRLCMVDAGVHPILSTVMGL